MSTCNYFFHPNQSSEFPKKYNRGKSFSFSPWDPSVTFTNDIFKQDFVTYKGDLWACINTNTNSVPGISKDWYLVMSKLPAETLIPNIDESGNISWSLQIGNELPTIQNIKGPRGERGERGEKGDVGEKGEKGEKGESGNGNMFIGNTVPDSKGYQNDIYLDINSGIFYKFDKEWNEVGSISVGGTSNIEWEDD